MSNDETTLKQAFAAALLRSPNDPFRAALQVFGSDTGRALRASQQWVLDSEVVSCQVKLLEEYGEEQFLPDKLALARAVFELAQNPNKPTDERLKAYELYGKIRGFIDRPAIVNNMDNRSIHLTTNKVMVMRDHGTDADWEQKALSQQQRLVSHARD